MPRPKLPSGIKDKIEIAQALVTIAAVFVGGFWTYMLFIKERSEVPHANIEQTISHVSISDKINLLRVGVELTNTGNSLMKLGNAIIRVQQILPLPPCPTQGPCAATEASAAANEVEQQGDRFPWPLIAERKENYAPTYDIEPGESQLLDFEFATPSKIQVVRVYSYFQNQQRQMSNGQELGWASSSYYDFRASEGGGKK